MAGGTRILPVVVRGFVGGKCLTPIYQGVGTLTPRATPQAAQCSPSPLERAPLILAPRASPLTPSIRHPRPKSEPDCITSQTSAHKSNLFAGCDATRALLRVSLGWHQTVCRPLFQLFLSFLKPSRLLAVSEGQSANTSDDREGQLNPLKHQSLPLLHLFKFLLRLYTRVFTPTRGEVHTQGQASEVGCSCLGARSPCGGPVFKSPPSEMTS